MAKLPNAPDPERLRSLTPSLKLIRANTQLHRIYKRGGDYSMFWGEFRYFGPTAARFDHHLPDEKGCGHHQDRGVLHLATDIPTAVAEVFQEKRSLNRTVGEPWLASFSITADLTLLNLTGTFCVRAGASMKLTSGATLHAQNWSRGFYEYYKNIQGLYYPSSLTNRPIIVLYERADAPKYFPKTADFHLALNDPHLLEPLRNVCRQIGYRLI